MLTTQRTAQVARTAYDLNHVNKLHFPEFWILSLCFSVGGKTSKSYLTSDAPKPSAAGAGADDFHFAPEKETPNIEYELDDPYAQIEAAKLEIFCRFRDKPLWSIDLKKVGGDDACTHGKHTLKWDGRLIKEPASPQAGTQSGGSMGQDLTQFDPDKTANADFPDGYLTIEHPPYKLKLTVSDKPEGTDGRIVRTAWTYFHVLLKKIDLELGPEKALPAAAAGQPDLDLLVYKDTDAESLNGSLPAEGARKKVILTSNIFKNTNGQMHNNSDFQAYQKLWGDGPNIPIFAKLWVRDSGDQPVECPKALGKAKFLWDAEDIPESAGSVFAGHYPAAKTFIQDGVDYYKDTTKPKGDNCHKDRGGKRGDDSKFFFPKQDGYGYGFGAPFDTDPQQDALKDRQFPFKVEPITDTRKWSSYSYAWTKGMLSSKTGVLFQPCRMAGDAYKITVYLAFDRKLDGGAEKIIVDTDSNDILKKVNADIKRATGTFEMWRRLNFVKYMKKKNAVTPNFVVATFQNYYKQANVEVVYTAGAAAEMPKADYDTKVTAAINNQDWYKKLMFSTAASQYDAGNYALDFRSWTDWKTAAKAAKHWSDADLTAFMGTVLNTESNYNKYCSNIASSVLTTVCEGFMDPADGINLFQFNEHYSLATSPGGVRLNGFAPGAAVGPKKNQTTNTQCFFVLCAGTHNYGADSNTPEQTVTHEIGHCLFMPHAPPQTATDEANKAAPEVHDKDFHNCTMSYNYDAERKWCGFCLFRLRGWDRSVLKNDAVQNKKP